MNRLMHMMPEEWRYYWCEAKVCGCSGCANRAGGLQAAGYTKEQWQAYWTKKGKKPADEARRVRENNRAKV